MVSKILGDYKRIERVLLKAGITSRQQLEQFDKRNGFRGIKGIGPKYEERLEDVLGESPQQFSRVLPNITQDETTTWADTVEDQYFKAGGVGG